MSDKKEIKVLINGSESLWAEISDKDFVNFYEDDKSNGDKFYGKLLNKPVAFDGIDWGSHVLITTQGLNKPFVLLEDNPSIKPL